ncbi:hypothetical protein [Adhaeribacter aerolatus]|nr:hypothetical protein [Adhaeribacter aerolatus]
MEALVAVSAYFHLSRQAKQHEAIIPNLPSETRHKTAQVKVFLPALLYA